MRFPDVLSALADQGIIDEVLRPLKSGKEAEVFLVVAGGVERVAKVYKQASHRSFKNRSIYEEGRRVRSSRDQRAMERRSRHGRAEQEQAWKSSEADAIFRLHAHGVRVPEPHHFIDGVLLMELVRGPGGLPAPRLAELSLGRDEAHTIFGQLLGEVVKMLCAGIVHGDLSDYNVLLDAAGPVVIDFPQAVDAAHNRNARQLLVRDVDNLSAFLMRQDPRARRRPLGQQIWRAFEDNTLTPEFDPQRALRSAKPAGGGGARGETSRRTSQREADAPSAEASAPPRTPRRREVVVMSPAGGGPGDGGASRRRRRRKPRAGGAEASAPK
ncbi:MAG: RIO1 family regulatory kinase/ATPase, partial [Myxococcota bacterium]